LKNLLRRKKKKLLSLKNLLRSGIGVKQQRSAAKNSTTVWGYEEATGREQSRPSENLAGEHCWYVFSTLILCHYLRCLRVLNYFGGAMNYLLCCDELYICCRSGVMNYMWL
jgi:hypothetical protein